MHLPAAPRVFDSFKALAQIYLSSLSGDGTVLALKRSRLAT
jgi:hypothetical protein